VIGATKYIPLDRCGTERVVVRPGTHSSGQIARYVPYKTDLWCQQIVNLSPEFTQSQQKAFQVQFHLLDQTLSNIAVSASIATVTFHFEHPYQSPRVRVTLDDTRAYSKTPRPVPG
jgi:hypothetical protein